MLKPARDAGLQRSGLVAVYKEVKGSIVKILQELEQHGYLERHQLRRNDGKMGGIEYVIYEMPREPCTENPDAAKLDAGKPRPENPPQLNKEQLSKEESNTDSNKRKKEKEPRHQYGEYGAFTARDAIHPLNVGWSSTGKPHCLLCANATGKNRSDTSVNWRR